jgi:CheY-like chemotaxis protein
MLCAPENWADTVKAAYAEIDCQMQPFENTAERGMDRVPPCVLIMEDEFIVALDLSDMTQDLGFRVEGPFATIAEGVRAVEDHVPDAAILDVQLADGEVYPLADRLMKLGVPIIFHSGHADNTRLLDRYPSARSASKPCAAEVIAGYLVQATAARR